MCKCSVSELYAYISFLSSACLYYSQYFTLEHDFWRAYSAICCFVTGIHCLASVPGRQLLVFKTVIVKFDVQVTVRRDKFL